MKVCILTHDERKEIYDFFNVLILWNFETQNYKKLENLCMKNFRSKIKNSVVFMKIKFLLDIYEWNQNYLAWEANSRFWLCH